MYIYVFLSVGEKIVSFLLTTNQLRTRQLFVEFVLSKNNHKALIPNARGQNRNFRYSYTFGVLLTVALRLDSFKLKRLFKLTKHLDHLMCNLKRSGSFTEKPDFVNLTVLSNSIRNCLSFFF